MSAGGPEIIAVGIDVAEARKGLDLVALACDGSIVESAGRLSPQQAVDLVLSLRPATVCIDSPSGWAVSGKSRLAERQLASIGIQSYRTGADPGQHAFYTWIRVGISLFERLADTYPLYGGGEPTGHAAEVFPHATAALLAGQLPHATRKTAFRRVLHHHRISERSLATVDRVDAALAALTGLLALGDCHTTVGDPHEGVILLPVDNLPAAPLTRLTTRRRAAAPQPRTSQSSRPAGHTVQIGYVNRNHQQVFAATGLPGTDHGQSVYALRCSACAYEYGSNGSDNFQRKCPRCQGGAPGPALQRA
jgi:predicted nuclease with RNAse H fold